jgi:8-oxo-dGTP pyrophosphatase MutT (NUDIX family)
MGRPMYLGTPDDVGELSIMPGPQVYHAPYLGKRKQIKQYLDLLDKNKAVEVVMLYTDQVDALWEDFQSCYKILEAAGGYVTNPTGELLVFERRGSWDMPKGKIDPGESPEAAAVREVQEETGLEHLELGPLVCHTWHTYEQNGERILKKTYWYQMTTTDTATTPQTEEDIERIEWVRPAEWLAQKPKVYGSIVDVIEAGIELSTPTNNSPFVRVNKFL